MTRSSTWSGGSPGREDARFPEHAERAQTFAARHQEPEAVEGMVDCRSRVAQCDHGHRRRRDAVEQRAELRDRTLSVSPARDRRMPGDDDMIGVELDATFDRYTPRAIRTVAPPAGSLEPRHAGCGSAPVRQASAPAPRAAPRSRQRTTRADQASVWDGPCSSPGDGVGQTCHARGSRDRARAAQIAGNAARIESRRGIARVDAGYHRVHQRLRGFAAQAPRSEGVNGFVLGRRRDESTAPPRAAACLATKGHPTSTRTAATRALRAAGRRETDNVVETWACSRRSPVQAPE